MARTQAAVESATPSMPPEMASPKPLHRQSAKIASLDPHPCTQGWDFSRPAPQGIIPRKLYTDNGKPLKVDSYKQQFPKGSEAAKGAGFHRHPDNGGEPAMHRIYGRTLQIQMVDPESLKIPGQDGPYLALSRDVLRPCTRCNSEDQSCPVCFGQKVNVTIRPIHPMDAADLLTCDDNGAAPNPFVRLATDAEVEEYLRQQSIEAKKMADLELKRVRREGH
jgi:hypothetical protein